MRLAPISRVETDEELLSHGSALPNGILIAVVAQEPSTRHVRQLSNAFSVTQLRPLLAVICRRTLAGKAFGAAMGPTTAADGTHCDWSGSPSGNCHLVS